MRVEQISAKNKAIADRNGKYQVCRDTEPIVQISFLNSDMEISEFINSMPAERQETLTAIHEAILANDPSVIPVIKPMMGKEMILYEERCYMKYGLASTKNYMSLHCMPMYMNPPLYNKFVSIFPNAKFQKGCMNFTDGEAAPPAAIAKMIAQCSSISIADMLEKRKKK
jgi:hypothetical protein